MTSRTAQADYAAADEAHRASYAAFQAATEAYRARKIDDATYLAVRRAHTAALDAFDIAYNIMQEG